MHTNRSKSNGKHDHDKLNEELIGNFDFLVRVPMATIIHINKF